MTARTSASSQADLTADFQPSPILNGGPNGRIAMSTDPTGLLPVTQAPKPAVGSVPMSFAVAPPSAFTGYAMTQSTTTLTGPQMVTMASGSWNGNGPGTRNGPTPWNGLTPGNGPTFGNGPAPGNGPTTSPSVSEAVSLIQRANGQVDQGEFNQMKSQVDLMSTQLSKLLEVVSQGGFGQSQSVDAGRVVLYNAVNMQNGSQPGGTKLLSDEVQRPGPSWAGVNSNIREFSNTTMGSQAQGQQYPNVGLNTLNSTQTEVKS